MHTHTHLQNAKNRAACAVTIAAIISLFRAIEDDIGYYMRKSTTTFIGESFFFSTVIAMVHNAMVVNDIVAVVVVANW